MLPNIVVHIVEIEADVTPPFALTIESVATKRMKLVRDDSQNFSYTGNRI